MNNKRTVVILGVLLAIATGAAIYFGVTGQKAKREATYVRVPDVTSLEASDAEKLIINTGLKVASVTTQHSDDVPDDHVISSDPKAKARVEEGTEVNLVVSSGPEAPAQVSVPDLKGMTQTDAEDALHAAKLVAVPADPEYTDEEPAGLVFKQSVDAGSKVDEGTQVTFTVALGQQTTTVPDVVGKSSADAKDLLTKASLGVDTTTSYSDTVDADVVISQSVSKGTTVALGTQVTINISLGAKPATKVKVPDIRTLKLADAENALESAGLAYRYSGDEDGTVTSVTPAVGTEVDAGSTVAFTLQAARTLVTVPDVSGMTAGAAGARMSQVGLVLDYDEDDADQVIDSTDPAAGASVDVGTKVEPTYLPEPTPEPVVGGWQVVTATASHLSDDARHTFDEAAAASGLSGTLNPIALIADDDTDDSLYLCYEGSDWALVKVEADDDGAQVATYATFLPPDVSCATGGCSGWDAVPEGVGSLTPDAQAAFDAATSDYEPIALLATQQASGTNYQVLCASNNTLYVVVIYQDASGSSSITDVGELNVGAYV